MAEAAREQRGLRPPGTWTPPARPFLPQVHPLLAAAPMSGPCSPAPPEGGPPLPRSLGAPGVGSLCPVAVFSWGRPAVLPAAAASLLLQLTAHPVLAVQPGLFRAGVPPPGAHRGQEVVCLPSSHPRPIPLPSRVESLEALPVLSRNPSRSTDRDWETASAASSLASVAEYTGDSLAFGGMAPSHVLQGRPGAGGACLCPAPVHDSLCVLGT